jgi:hypothetical protein
MRFTNKKKEWCGYRNMVREMFYGGGYACSHSPSGCLYRFPHFTPAFAGVFSPLNDVRLRVRINKSLDVLIDERIKLTKNKRNKAG